MIGRVFAVGVDDEVVAGGVLEGLRKDGEVCVFLCCDASFGYASSVGSVVCFIW